MMADMGYKILRTATADEQLWEIVLRRKMITGRTAAAMVLLDDIESSIRQLEMFPDSGSQPRYAALRMRGFRALIVDKFIVFYKVDHAARTVTVHAVVDGRSDYLKLI